MPAPKPACRLKRCQFMTVIAASWSTVTGPTLQPMRRELAGIEGSHWCNSFSLHKTRGISLCFAALSLVPLCRALGNQHPAPADSLLGWARNPRQC